MDGYSDLARDSPSAATPAVEVSYEYEDYFYLDGQSATPEAPPALELSHGASVLVQELPVVIYCATCLLGLLGNGLVIAMATLKMKRSTSTVWFLNLALADFLFNVFLPLNIAYTAMGYHWAFGRCMCKVNSLLLNLNMYTSVFLLTMISFDRCVSVVFPVWAQNHRGPRLAWGLCALVWALGFLMSSPSLVFRDTFVRHNGIACFNNFSLSQSPADAQLGRTRHLAVTVARFLAGFVVPLAVIMVCYLVIVSRLKRNRLAKSKKPLRIIAALITIFFLCWCPYHVFHLLETQHHLVPPSLLRVGLPIVTAIAVSNSCMNPVLYVFMGQDFKNFKVAILSRLANALSEETVHGSLSRRSVTRQYSTTEKETVLL